MLRAVGGAVCGTTFTLFLLATLGMEKSLHYPLSYSQALIGGIAVLFFASAFRDWREARAAETAHPEAVRSDAPGGTSTMLVSAALCVAYAMAWPVLGFFLATFIYVAIQLWLLRERGPLLLIGVPTGVTLLVYVVFARLLALPFPQGAWFGG
jgi:phosphate/sulfate permease